MTHTEILNAQGTIIIKKAQSNLMSNKPFKKVDTGALYKSLGFRVEEIDNADYELQFDYLPYGYWVDQGRAKGVKGPPPNVLKDWMKRKGIPESAFFPIMKKIKKEGIKPTYFFSDAVEAVDYDQVATDLAQSMADTWSTGTQDLFNSRELVAGVITDFSKMLF